MKFKILIVTTIFFLNLSGCQLLPEDKQLKSFRVLIQQGNVIDESKVNLLKINMSKEQVIFLLGEPVVNNIFNKNRWDYVYYRKRDPEETQLNMISIFF
jgi:outer membrane protein assembly factor BamE